MSRRPRFKATPRRFKPGTNGISAPSAVKRATILLDRRPSLVQEIDALIANEVGPHRTIGARAFFALAIALGMLGRRGHLTEITKLIGELGPGQRGDLGLRRKNRKPVTYCQVEGFLATVAGAFLDLRDDHPVFDSDSGLVYDAETGEVVADARLIDNDAVACATACRATCPARRNLEEVMNRLIGEMWRALRLPMPDDIGMDSYVVGTHFGARSWGGYVDIDPDHVPESDKPARARLEPEKKAKSGSNSRKRQRDRASGATAAQYRSALRQRAAWETPDPRPAKSRRPEPIGPTAVGDFGRIDEAFPQIGPTGRIHHTIDPYSATGYRGAGRSRHSGFANGRDFHGVAATGTFPDGTPCPSLLLGYATCAAGGQKPEPTLDALRRARHNGIPVGTNLTLDRAYTSGQREAFEAQAEALGFRTIKSLTDSQRAMTVVSPHVVMIDGTYFTVGLPDDMMQLPAVGRKDNRQERDQKTLAFDKRLAFAFQVHHEDGMTIRFRGPCTVSEPVRDQFGRLTSWRKGRLTARCVNHPDFAQMPVALPKTTCTSGVPCGCSSTFTVPKADLPAAYMPVAFMATKWHTLYGPRSLTETQHSNAMLHNGEGRHHYRVTGPKWDVMHGLWKVGVLLSDIHHLLMRMGVAPQHTLDPEAIRQVTDALAVPHPERSDGGPPRATPSGP